MTIWINTAFDSLPGEAGRPLRYAQLAEVLVSRGHHVVIWSSNWHHQKKADRGLPMTYCQKGIEVRLIPTKPYYSNVGWARWRSHAAYAREWEHLARESVALGASWKPDWILLAMPPLSLFSLAEGFRREWGSRLIVDVQDLWPETFYRLLPRGLRFLGKLIFYSAPLLSG